MTKQDNSGEWVTMLRAANVCNTSVTKISLLAAREQLEIRYNPADRRQRLVHLATIKKFLGQPA